MTPARLGFVTIALGALVLAAVQAGPVTARADGLRARPHPLICSTQPASAGYPPGSEWVVYGEVTLVTDGADNWFQDGTAS